MIDTWWLPQITNMLTHLFKIENFHFFLHFRGTKCRVEANNREAFFVCARHVRKRLGKRSALVDIKSAETNLLNMKSL